MGFSDLRRECYETNLLLPQFGLVDLTFGNASVFDRDAGVFAIKPSGVAYAALRPADMVVLDLDGSVVAGALRPSSDTATHRRLFLGFPGIRSVAHTHSRKAVAFAQAGLGIPCLGTTHADFFAGEVPVTRALTPAEVAGDYEWETGNVIVERFAALDPSAIPAALVRGHGPFAWGPTGAAAAENALALEIAADLALATFRLRPAAEPLPAHLRGKHFLRKHGPAASYGQR